VREIRTHGLNGGLAVHAFAVSKAKDRRIYQCLKRAPSSAQLLRADARAAGEVEVDCDYCDSRVRLLPGSDEMEVVRTREELKSRERVTLEQERLRRQVSRRRPSAGARPPRAWPLPRCPCWAAARVAPRRRALRRPGGCLGCGCLLPLALLLAAGSALAAALW